MAKKKKQDDFEYIDLFAEDEEETPSTSSPLEEEEEDYASYEDSGELPLQQDAPDAKTDTPRYSFDRYGRRQGLKSARNKRIPAYGKRKGAKQASTTLIIHDTAVTREQEAARQRAAEREQLRQEQYRRQQAKQRKKRQEELKRRITGAAVFLGLLLLVVFALFIAFQVRSIEVIGSQSYDRETIIELSGLQTGKHILFQDLDEAEEKLRGNPYLIPQVSYVFPNRISITVRERKPLGAVSWGPNLEFMAIIDGEGTVLQEDTDSRGSLPLIEGILVTRIVAGSPIGNATNEQVQSMLDVLNGLDSYGLLSKIDRANLVETMGISLYTKENYRIELGNAKDLDVKFSRLKNNYMAVMSTAQEYIQKGADNVTVYLYSKNGITVSPHELGYVVPNQEPILPNPDPGAPQAPTQPPVSTPEPSGDPQQPENSDPPHQDDPFLG